MKFLLTGLLFVSSTRAGIGPSVEQQQADADRQWQIGQRVRFIRNTWSSRYPEGIVRSQDVRIREGWVGKIWSVKHNEIYVGLGEETYSNYVYVAREQWTDMISAPEDDPTPSADRGQLARSYTESQSKTTIGNDEHDQAILRELCSRGLSEDEVRQLMEEDHHMIKHAQAEARESRAKLQMSIIARTCPDTAAAVGRRSSAVAGEDRHWTEAVQSGFANPMSRLLPESAAKCAGRIFLQGQLDQAMLQNDIALLRCLRDGDQRTAAQRQGRSDIDIFYEHYTGQVYDKWWECLKDVRFD